jgi:hypothetical protein
MILTRKHLFCKEFFKIFFEISNNAPKTSTYGPPPTIYDIRITHQRFMLTKTEKNHLRRITIYVLRFLRNITAPKPRRESVAGSGYSTFSKSPFLK